MYPQYNCMPAAVSCFMLVYLKMSDMFLHIHDSNWANQHKDIETIKN